MGRAFDGAEAGRGRPSPPAAADDDARVRVLRAHGARGKQLDELLEYLRNRFRVGPGEWARSYPLADEPSVAAWQEYAESSGEDGVFASLQQRLVQLRFPILEGISESPAYLAATRRGELSLAPPPDEGLELEEPAGLRLFLHPTAAGRIPVLVAASRDDFVALLRALGRRNEPDPIPPAQGATMLAGFNNWDRIARYRRQWQASHPDEDWKSEFARLVPRKELYQDRFILLSSGPYSGVRAADLGLARDDWLERSLTLRLEHECCHYFTRRVLGSMRNALHDELIADYMGIVAAAGRYRADWFLRFMGLEAYPRYRRSGRLGNYRGEPPLTAAAFRVLRSLVRTAARNLEAFDRRRPLSAELPARARRICELASRSLEELAAPDAVERLTGARA